MPPDRQPSATAVDLISRLIIEKEHRLGTRRYALNDWTRKTMDNSTSLFASDKHSQSYCGYFVYPNDAEDIKSHPWFTGLPWQTLHLRRPPFVPQVKTWEDTKYFDDEDPISDVDSSDSGSDQGSLSRHSHQPEAQHIVSPIAIQSRPVDGQGHLLKDKEQRRKSLTVVLQQPQIDGPTSLPISGAVRLDTATTKEASNIPRKPKERKRPRDKILRDANTAMTALQMRRNGSFLGYGYHRPRDLDEIIYEAMCEEGTLPGQVEEVTV